jgi:hypothetical protein
MAFIDPVSNNRSNAGFRIEVQIVYGQHGIEGKHIPFVLHTNHHRLARCVAVQEQRFHGSINASAAALGTAVPWTATLQAVARVARLFVAARTAATVRGLDRQRSENQIYETERKAYDA